MRLLQLRLAGFRSHRRPTAVDFERGVNVFLGGNEAGKTGILLGVQTALFVPRYAAEREALIAEGETACSVGLDYELEDGSRWRIERDVAANRGSLLQWVDGRWEALATSPTDIAAVVRRHTGCDEQLFRASLLVRHEQIEVADSSDITRALSERLEVLVAGSAGGVSAARAVSRLQQAINRLTGPRAGQIVAARQAAAEARARLARANDAATRSERGRPRLEELAAQESALLAEREELLAVVDRARALRDLEEKLAATRHARAAIDRSLDARATFQRLESEAATARSRVPAAPAPPAPRPAWARPLLVTGAVVAVLSFVLLLLQPVPGIAGLLLGLAAAVSGWRFSQVPAPAPPDAASAEAERAARAAEKRRDEALGEARALDPRPEAELISERARLGRDLAEVEADLAAQAIFRVETRELERAAVRARELPGLIRRATEERIGLELELRNLEASTLPVAELEDELAVADADLERLRLRAEAMELARTELEGAIADIREGVGPEIATAAGRRLAAIVPDYAVRLAGESGLSFRPCWASGADFERRELSDGTADQFYFAVRVALADVLLEGVNPPLLLDDPFRYCDDARRVVLHRLLEEIGLERQVLYFTIEEPMGLRVTHPLPLARVTSA